MLSVFFKEKGCHPGLDPGSSICSLGAHYPAFSDIPCWTQFFIQSVRKNNYSHNFAKYVEIKGMDELCRTSLTGSSPGWQPLSVSTSKIVSSWAWLRIQYLFSFSMPTKISYLLFSAFNLQLVTYHPDMNRDLRCTRLITILFPFLWADNRHRQFLS